MLKERLGVPQGPKAGEVWEEPDSNYGWNKCVKMFTVV